MSNCWREINVFTREPYQNKHEMPEKMFAPSHKSVISLLTGWSRVLPLISEIVLIDESSRRQVSFSFINNQVYADTSAERRKGYIRLDRRRVWCHSSQLNRELMKQRKMLLNNRHKHRYSILTKREHCRWRFSKVCTACIIMTNFPRIVSEDRTLIIYLKRTEKARWAQLNLFVLFSSLYNSNCLAVSHPWRFCLVSRRAWLDTYEAENEG